MESLAPVIGVGCGLLFLLVAVAVLVQRRRDRERAERRRRWARRYGWQFTEHPRVVWSRRLPGANRNGVGFAFSAVYRDTRVTVAEYSVTSAIDAQHSTTDYYVVTVVLLTRRLPPTEVEPRGRVSRLQNRIFGPGETATGDPAFDRDFRIRTTEPARLREWFGPALIGLHTAGGAPPAWTVQENELLSYRPGRLEPDGVKPAADAIVPLAQALDAV